MAYVSDGSVPCTAGSRATLVAVDAAYTLTSKSQLIIYAVGIKGTTGDRMRAATGNVALHWRRAGGTFAAMTNATEVKIAASGTILVNGTAVTAANGRCNETPTFTAAGIEVQGVASSTAAAAVELRDIASGEWQYALDFSGALDNQAYEFKLVVTQDVANPDITLASVISTPVVVANIHLYPASDISVGTWTSTGPNLFSVVDEVVADDADYIQSAVAPVNDVAEVRLQAPATVTAGTWTVTVRASKA